MISRLSSSNQAKIDPSHGKRSCSLRNADVIHFPLLLRLPPSAQVTEFDPKNSRDRYYTLSIDQEKRRGPYRTMAQVSSSPSSPLIDQRFSFFGILRPEAVVTTLHPGRDYLQVHGDLFAYFSKLFQPNHSFFRAQAVICGSNTPSTFPPAPF